jgi:hypothetical protein
VSADHLADPRLFDFSGLDARRIAATPVMAMTEAEEEALPWAAAALEVPAAAELPARA